MDKRARLLSDLKDICASSSLGSGASRTVFEDITFSDMELASAINSDVEDSESDFSDDSSNMDDLNLDSHLELMWPTELEQMGLQALRLKDFDNAVKFLNLARLEWTESLIKSLALGRPVKVDEAAVRADWLIGKYIQLAVSKGDFVERHTLLEEFQSLAVASRQQAHCETC